MEQATQLSVNLRNEPGRLAELCDVVADAGINILAISLVDQTEQGIARLVVDRTDDAVELLEKRSFPCVGTPVLLVSLKNEVGSLAKLTRNLANSGVNINYVYGSAGDVVGESLIVVAVSDIDRAARALGQNE